LLRVYATLDSGPVMMAISFIGKQFANVEPRFSKILAGFPWT
jgi:hypothetical protein